MVGLLLMNGLRGSDQVFLEPTLTFGLMGVWFGMRFLVFVVVVLVCLLLHLFLAGLSGLGCI